MKNLKLYLLLIFLSATFIPVSAHADSNKKDFLIAGDSWAEFMCLDESFQVTFFKHKIKSQVLGCDGATQFGGRAVEWLTYKASGVLDKHLKSNPAVNVVYLSLGGNDFLGNWNKNMTIAQENELAIQVLEGIDKVIEHILNLRPDVKILISGYDYGNFKDYSKIIKAYTKLYEHMGKPSALEVDSAVLRFSNQMVKLVNGQNIFYIHHYGISHYYYGNPEYHLAPHQTAPPDQISPPSNPMAYGGVPGYEVASASLLHLLFIQDAYHPNCPEFLHIAEHTFKQYLSNWLR